MKEEEVEWGRRILECKLRILFAITALRRSLTSQQRKSRMSLIRGPWRTKSRKNHQVWRQLHPLPRHFLEHPHSHSDDTIKCGWSLAAINLQDKVCGKSSHSPRRRYLLDLPLQVARYEFTKWLHDTYARQKYAIWSQNSPNLPPALGSLEVLMVMALMGQLDPRPCIRNL